MKNLIKQYKTKKFTKNLVKFVSTVIYKGSKHIAGYNYSLIPCSPNEYGCGAYFDFDNKQFGITIIKMDTINFNIFVCVEDKNIEIASFDSTKDYELQWNPSFIELKPTVNEMLLSFNDITDNLIALQKEQEEKTKKLTKQKLNLI